MTPKSGHRADIGYLFFNVFVFGVVFGDTAYQYALSDTIGATPAPRVAAGARGGTQAGVIWAYDSRKI